MPNPARHFLSSIAVALVALALLLLTTSTLSADVAPVTAWGWTTPQNLTSNEGASTIHLAFTDAAGNFHLFWLDDSYYPYSTSQYYMVRNPAGVWSPIEKLPGEFHYAVGINGLVTADGTVHVVHRRNNHFMYLYKPLGGEWTEQITVTRLPADANAPYLYTGSAGTLHSFWGPYYYMLSPGGTWTFATTTTFTYGFGPVIDHNDLLHTVWAENGEIYYATQAPFQPRSQPLNLSNNPTPSDRPEITMDATGSLHVAWRDLDGPRNYGIFYRSKSGDTWSATENATDAPLKVVYGSLAVSPKGSPFVQYRTENDDYFLASRHRDGTWMTSASFSGPLYVGPDGDVHIHTREQHHWKRPNSDWFSTIPPQDPGPLYWFFTAPGFRAFALDSVTTPDGFHGDIFLTELYSLSIRSLVPLSLTYPLTSVVELTGHGFLSNTSVTLHDTPDYADNPVTGTVLSATPDRLQFTIPADMAVGRYDIYLNNPEGVSVATPNQPLEITYPSPVITQILPSTLTTRVDSWFEILGSNFYPDLTVKLSDQLLDVTSVTPTRIQVDFSPTMPTGVYSLTVANAGPGAPSALYAGLVFTDPPPPPAQVKHYIPNIHAR